MNIFLLSLFILPFLLTEELFLQAGLAHPLFLSLVISVVNGVDFETLLIPSLFLTLLFFDKKSMGQAVDVEKEQFSGIFFISYIYLLPKISGTLTNVPFISFLIASLLSYLSIKLKIRIRELIDDKEIKYSLLWGFLLNSFRYLLFILLGVVLSYVISLLNIWDRLYLPFIPYVSAIIVATYYKRIRILFYKKDFYNYLLLSAILVALGWLL